MVMKRLIYTLLMILVLVPCQAKNEKTGGTTLIVMGQGKTLDEATKVALRSAIEQTFSVFVSSNTTVINDAMAKDEIATVSSGNIEKYECVSQTQAQDGTYNVTLRVRVSVGKLLSFVKSANIPGVPATIDGAAFAMNVKMGLLYRQNELLALLNMATVMSKMALQMVDPAYVVKIGDPTRPDKDIVKSGDYDYKDDGKTYIVPINITMKLNKAAVKAYKEYFLQTMNTLSLDENQVEVMKSYSVTPTKVVIGNWPVKKGTENLEFYLRNNSVYIAYAFNRITAGFSAIDNISNRITIKDNLDSYDYNLSWGLDRKSYRMSYELDSQLCQKGTFAWIGDGHSPHYISRDYLEKYSINSNDTPTMEQKLSFPLDEDGCYKECKGALKYTLDELQKVNSVTVTPTRPQLK